MKLGELLSKYNSFNSKNDKVSPQKFSSLMRELGFVYKRTTNCNQYVVQYEELKKVADTRKWICGLDREGMHSEYNNDDYEYGIDKTDKSVDIALECCKQINDIKHELEDIKLIFTKKDFIDAIGQKPKTKKKDINKEKTLMLLTK